MEKITFGSQTDARTNHYRKRARSVLTSWPRNQIYLLTSALESIAVSLKILLSFLPILLTSCNGDLSKYRVAESNLIIIIIDTLRRDHLTCYSYEKDISPNIDMFSETAMCFNNAVSQAPWTKPSMATLFTAAYPSVHKAVRGLQGEGDILSESFLTLAEILQQSGYGTCAFQTNPNLIAEMGLAQGFDSYNFHPYADSKQLNKRIVSWLKSNGSEKFFLYIHYMDPHLSNVIHQEFPLDTLDVNPESRINDKTTRNMIMSMNPTENEKRVLHSRYEGEIRFVDAQIGDLISGLKKLNLYERSIVVITSDHGEEFWDHGGFEHGHSLFHEVIDVPLLIHHPKINTRLEIPRIIGLIDVSPMLLDMLDITRPASMAGATLEELLNGDNARKDYFAEGLLYGSEKKCIMTKEWKLVIDSKFKATHLFDIRKDPFERENLLEKGFHIPEELKSALNRWVETSKRQSEAYEYAGPITLDSETVEHLKALGYVDTDSAKRMISTSSP